MWPIVAHELSRRAASRDLDLLPRLAQMDDVDPVHGATEDVALHAVVDVASAQVGLANQPRWTSG